MPEQNPQNAAAFNPAAFSLPASLTTNKSPSLVYSVIANSDQPALSSYTQTVFHRSSGRTSPGATLTDQTPPTIRNAGDMHQNINGAGQSQNYMAPQTFAPPIIDAQQHREQSAQTYRLTDQTPAVGDAIYYPPAPTQSSESFAPPANRSTLPYVPKENTKPSERSEAVESVLEVSKKSAPKANTEQSSQTRSQTLIEKTKLVDLRPRSQEPSELTVAKQPARDANTTVDQQSSSTPVEQYSETGFLKRQAFSNKFSVTRTTGEEKKSTKKVIYLKSAPVRSAKLEVPQFRQPAELEAKPVQPRSVPAYAMLPPIPSETSTTEISSTITSTVSESTTFTPEAAPAETAKESIPEPVTAFVNPFSTPATSPTADLVADFSR